MAQISHENSSCLLFQLTCVVAIFRFFFFGLLFLILASVEVDV